MKHKYKSVVNHIVNPYVDHSVYKLKSRQLFRHLLSTKYYGPDDKDKTLNRDNADYILEELKPEHRIITPDGHEKLITQNEWINAFPSIAVETSDDEDEIIPVQKNRSLSAKEQLLM